MSALGLSLVLLTGSVFGLLFGIYPELDVWFSSLFFDRTTNTFIYAGDENVAFWRSANIYLFIGALTLLCIRFVAVALRAPSVERREAATCAFWFLALTAIVGPGLLVNGVLKEQWGRPRPGTIAEFNAPADSSHAPNAFTSWWRTDGGCKSNCSFVAGEASIAFWLLAPAALIATQRRRRLAYAAVLAVGGLAGLLRIAVGGHFLSDVIFAGVAIFVVVWVTHRLVYYVPWLDILSARSAGSKNAPQASPAGIPG